MFHFHYPSLTPWMQNRLFLGSLPQNIANYTPCPLRTQRKNAAPLPERKKKMLPAVVAFEALCGVDCAAECRHGVDADGGMPPILSPTSSTFSASFASHSSCFTSWHSISKGPTPEFHRQPEAKRVRRCLNWRNSILSGRLLLVA